WLTPAAAAGQAGEFRDRNPDGSAVLYARVNADPAARARLEREADRYAGFASYAAHFARLGFGAHDTVLSAPDDVRSRIAEYAPAVDELVLRAITPEDRLEEFWEFLPLAG